MKRLFSVVLFALLVLSCGTTRQMVQAPLSSEELVEYLWTFKDSRPDGFTLSLGTLTEPSEGISVAYEITDAGNYTKEDLNYIVSHSLSHDGHVGGWMDERDSSYCFDSVRIFPEDQRSEALEFARENKQAAIYVLSTGEVIWVERKE